MYTVSFQLRFMSWLISSQEEGKIFLHQMVGDWKEETQEFCLFVLFFLAVSPSYTVCFPVWRHPWHTILYPTELFSQPPSFPEEQHMQSPLPQLLFLKGSDLASLLTEFPALSMTLTSIPMEIPKSLQAAFIFSVSSPAVGSIINGAETLLAPVWCQVVAFLSFSSLGAALCKLLARWIGRTPPSSSSHIFLNFLTASMMTWWRTVSG